MEKITVTLSRPIKLGEQEISEIAFREPTGADIRSCGYPITIKDEGQSFEINAAAMHRMMAALSDLPSKIFDRLALRDWNKCSQALLPFLGGEEGEEVGETGAAGPTSGGGSSDSPGSGG